MSGPALRLAIRRLQQHYGIEPVVRRELPLFAATSSAMVIEGLAASTTVIDSERTLFAPRSLSFRELPPLLYRHKGPSVGRITDLTWSSQGLHIRAIVDDAVARQAPALSVCASVHTYELQDVDSATKFHALITSATVDEISLTPLPACKACLITSRESVSPQHEFFEFMQKRVNILAELIRQLRERAA